MSVRRIPYGGPEHQRFELWARHRHAHDDAGRMVDWGCGGGPILRVTKYRGRGTAEIIGEDGRNVWGRPHIYTDYFLSEDTL
jgi:hypothetical protein